MSADEKLAARLEKLESLYAHQDVVVTELSDALAQQWKRIDVLTRELLRLRDEVQTATQRAAPDKPPPHY